MQCGLCKARRNAACACARAALLVKLLSVTEVNCRWKLTGLLVLCRLDLPALLTFLLVRAAPKLYPVRIKVENVIAKEEVWLTNAYLSSVRTEKGSSGAERSRQRRIAIIQRVLFLALRRLNRASHTGVGFVNAAGRKLLAFPRVLLYLCDQPEERAVLCLKPGQCAKPCSTCDVFLAFLSAPSALTAKQRSVLNSLHPQLEAAGHMLRGRERRRRLNIERAHGVNSYMPALAALAGLTTAPILLYKMIGLDILHVCRAVILLVGFFFAAVRWGSCPRMWPSLTICFFLFLPWHCLSCAPLCRSWTSV